MILLVLLAALLFRAEPFLPLHGGQDQGVYVSMSAHLQREGSVFIDDPVPDALPSERARDIYDSRLSWNRGQSLQPGIYLSRTRGDYVFQFYHLHPLWMATFAELFGDGARFYSLTFFSLLSIVGLCLLVLEITGARMAALVTGLLLALNPLHVFFSRLHVTEIVALAFSAMGLYYLARAARGAGHDPGMFAVRSVYELSEHEDRADLVVCCEVLEHLQDPRAALTRLEAAADRHLILSVPREPLWRALNVLRGAYLRDLGNTPGHVQHWSRRAFVRFVSAVSTRFDIIDQCTPTPWTMLFCRRR